MCNWGLAYVLGYNINAKMEDDAIPAADRLDSLVPGSGHLVHMPSHIYIRVGRYHDAAIANQKAIAVDEDYITQCHAQGVYPLAYMPHNHHFLWFAATWDINTTQDILKVATEVLTEKIALQEGKNPRAIALFDAD